MAERTGRQTETPWVGHNSACLERVEIAKLRRSPRDPRRFSKSDIERAKPVVTYLADRALPIVVGENYEILCGGVLVEAARAAGIKYLQVIRQDGLDKHQALIYSIAINKMLSAGDWDGEAMADAVRQFEREIEGFASDLIGFSHGELDRLIGSSIPTEGADELPASTGPCVSKIGSIWALKLHRAMCGDTTLPPVLATLMNGRLAAAAICDPPFGCAIDGFVSKRGKHRNFVQAAGDMNDDELLAFFRNACSALLTTLEPGALVYLFIDWRSLSLLQQAAEEVFGKIINFCVWSKDRAGMGSLYRSRHELVLVLAVPGAKHRNNIELGRHGRDRSNVWDYPCAASSRKGREGDLLKLHPTPKSVEMIADTILDCTSRGEIVIDTFLGSGTALIAAERTGRICYGADLDPRFVDLAIRRWQRWTGEKAIDVATGKSFDELEAEILAGEAQ